MYLGFRVEVLWPTPIPAVGTQSCTLLMGCYHRAAGSEVSVRLQVAGYGRVEDEDGMLVRGKRIKKDIGLSGDGLGCVSVSYVAGFPGKSL